MSTHLFLALPTFAGSRRRRPSGLPPPPFWSVGKEGLGTAAAELPAGAAPPPFVPPPGHVGRRTRPTPAPDWRESSCTKNSRRSTRSYSWCSCSNTVRARGPPSAPATGSLRALLEDVAAFAAAEFVAMDGCRARSRNCKRRSASVPGGGG